MATTLSKISHQEPISTVSLPPISSQPPSLPIDDTSALTLNGSLAPIQTTPFIPPLSLSQNTSLLNKIDSLLETQKEPLISLDALSLEIFKIMERHNSSSLRTKELFLTAHKDWQHAIEKELLTASEKSRKMNGVTNIVSKIGHTMGPLSVLIASAITCATGGVGIVALGAAAIGALFFIDTLCNDAGKRAIATLLARGDNEKEETWLQRIQFTASILSLCLNMGINLPQALQIASTISQTAMEAVQVGCDWSRDSAKAHLMEEELNNAISKSFSDYSLKGYERLVSNISDLFTQFMNFQKVRSETRTQIIQHI